FLTFFVVNPDSFTDIAIVLPTLVGRRLAAIMAGRSDIFVAKWRAASPAGLVGCRCAAANAGLRDRPGWRKCRFCRSKNRPLRPDCEELILALLFCCLPSMAATLRAITL